MQLIELVRSAPRRLVAPLAGYPGAVLTGSTLRQNLFNARLQARSLAALAARLEPDALFCMMDLSVEAGALGLPVRYPLHESPTVERHLIRGIADLEHLRRADPLDDARLRMFLDVIRLMARDIPVLHGAYVTGPFTLAGLMLGANEIAIATIDTPDFVDAALELAEATITRYAQELVRAGADLLAILDPTAVLLSPRAFERFCAGPLRRIIAAVTALGAMPVLHICGNTTRLLPMMCATGAQGLSLDAPVDLVQAAAHVPADMVLIGNLDPVRIIRDGSPASVRAAAHDLLRVMAPFPNFILSSGCDLPPDTPIDSIVALVAAAREGL